MHFLHSYHHHKHFSIHYHTDIKFDHCRDFTRDIHCYLMSYHLVHQLHRKRLHIHHQRNRVLLEDFEDINLTRFQYQHTPNYQPRNLLQDNHIPNCLGKKEHLDFHKVQSKLLMHLLHQKNHHILIYPHPSYYMKVDHFMDLTRQYLNNCSEQLHIHYSHNRDFPKHYVNNLISCFQYQHITNYQARNLRFHILNQFRKNLHRNFRITPCKLLMHLLNQKDHHTHFLFDFHSHMKEHEMFYFKQVFRRRPSLKRGLAQKLQIISFSI